MRGGDESEERKGNGARWLDFGMGERTCLAGVSTREASSGPPANAWSESTWSNPSQISSRLSKPSQPHPRKAPGWPSKAAGGASKAGQQEQATVPTRVTQNFVFARSRRFADLDFRVPSGLPVGIDLDNRAANLPLLYFAKTHRCFSLFVSFFSSCTFKFFHYRHNCLLAWPSTISSLPHTTTPLPSRPPIPPQPTPLHAHTTLRSFFLFLLHISINTPTGLFVLLLSSPQLLLQINAHTNPKSTRSTPSFPGSPDPTQARHRSARGSNTSTTRFCAFSFTSPACPPTT